ncbi:DEAD/DEAH box helicase [bacterium]|nr:DEAD/DEAH box helicase [bacterium]
MGLVKIQEWILNNTDFRQRLSFLTAKSVMSQFPNLTKNVYEIEHDWKYLLFCASILCQSNKESQQDAALRIAQACMIDENTSKIQKETAAIILQRLANYPAINLAVHRCYLETNLERRLPLGLACEWIHNNIEHTVGMANGNVLTLNDLQLSVWKEAEQIDWLSVSAPTSSGKSYILLNWLMDRISKSDRMMCAVYVVPTRALITQVESDCLAMVKDNGLSANVIISQMPLNVELSNSKHNVFILTQERLHLLLMELRDRTIDLIIVDEAHKISDGYRGTLLQQVLDYCCAINEQIKIIFASPLTQNPEIFFEDAPRQDNNKSIPSEQITVNQNLIWISQIPRNSKIYKLELCVQECELPLGTIELLFRPVGVMKKVPFIAERLGSSDGGNLIYVNGAAVAEKESFVLYDLMPEMELDGELRELIELVQKTIHEHYLLATVLRKGIAFHYGNMPLLIRMNIERLFVKNVIKYLFTTSTLLEGVNLPCKNIFVRGPKRGNGNIMSAADFWNLAGRAGRWGKEFQGNIFCIDAREENVWEGGAPRIREKYMIERSSDRIMNDAHDFISYVNERTPRNIARQKPEYDYLLSYLMWNKTRYGSIEKAPWAKRINPEKVQLLSELIDEAHNKIAIPENMIIKHPGISPYAMENLVKYFESYSGDITQLQPVMPESRDAYDVYARIIKIINEFLSNTFGPSEKRIYQISYLILLWMRGMPLAVLISKRLKSHPEHVAKVIRDVMKDVEQYARFEAPKYFACYIDMLNLFYRSKERQDLVIEIPEISNMLEFGVSQKTQLALVAMGLSRTTTLEISSLIANDSLTKEECLDWIKQETWRDVDMPVLVKKELSDFLQQKAQD